MGAVEKIKKRAQIMTKSVKWFVRAGLMHLLFALFLYAFMAIDLIELPGTGYIAALHAITIGWLSQLIFGVALWIFPRSLSKSTLFTDEQPRWVIWTLLNAGMVARYFHELIGLHTASLAGLLLWLASVGFIILIWGRIREK